MTIERELDTLIAAIGKDKASKVFAHDRARTIEDQFHSLAFPTDSQNLTSVDLDALTAAARTLPRIAEMRNNTHVTASIYKQRTERTGSPVRQVFTVTTPFSAAAPVENRKKCPDCGAALSSTGCKVCGGAEAKATKTKVMRRADFDKLSDRERSAFCLSGGKLTK